VTCCPPRSPFLGASSPHIESDRDRASPASAEHMPGGRARDHREPDPPRHSPEEIYVQVSRHARHGRLTFPALRGKYRHKRRRTARPRRRSRATRTTATLSTTSTTQLHYQHHTVALPAPWQFEVAGPTSGCRASPQQYVPSHVFGAVKSRGVLTPADSIKYEIRESEEREGRTPLDRPPPAGFVARRGHRSFHRTRGGLRSRLCDPRTGAVPCGWCGYDNPTFLSVDGVSDP
jgi:hypothetical protein